jgi:hypothetical protein
MGEMANMTQEFETKKNRREEPDNEIGVKVYIRYVNNHNIFHIGCLTLPWSRNKAGTNFPLCVSRVTRSKNKPSCH